ncbi:MAG: hypothetical protein WA817_08875 [Candidatus Acidiferrum sp.]
MIPLIENKVEVLLYFLHRLGIELELAFTAGADAMDDCGAFEDLKKMLGDRLATDFRASR